MFATRVTPVGKFVDPNASTRKDGTVDPLNAQGMQAHEVDSRGDFATLLVAAVPVHGVAAGSKQVQSVPHFQAAAHTFNSADGTSHPRKPRLKWGDKWSRLQPCRRARAGCPSRSGTEPEIEGWPQKGGRKAPGQRRRALAGSGQTGHTGLLERTSRRCQGVLPGSKTANASLASPLRPLPRRAPAWQAQGNREPQVCVR